MIWGGNTTEEAQVLWGEEREEKGRREGLASKPSYYMPPLGRLKKNIEFYFFLSGSKTKLACVPFSTSFGVVHLHQVIFLDLLALTLTFVNSSSGWGPVEG